MQIRFRPTLSAFATASVLAIPMLATATAALATDNALPGVESTHRIVKPLPPEPDDPEPAGPRKFKVGNFEVEVHGKIVVEFGFGDTPRRRK